MRLALGPRGLRARIVLGFAAVTLLVSIVLVATTFLAARSYLLDQRESSLTRQAFADANVFNSRLATAGADVGQLLAELVPSGGADVVVRSGESWYSSSLDVGARDVPEQLRGIVTGGDAGTAFIETVEGPALVVGLPLHSAGVEYYEVAPLQELGEVLRTLSVVLGAAAVAATVAGAGFGVWAGRRAVQPLEQVAGAATRIAGGELTTRLPPTDDPDLVAIVGGFNSMVDALAARIDRDARFVGDVSHELRSPLTTLVTSVEVLGARRGELSPRGQQALTLVEGELGRFRRTLDDLLQLARLDDAAAVESARPLPMTALVREVLAVTGRPADLLSADPEELTIVRGDKTSLERAVRNLLDNADRHAGGAVAVGVRRREDTVVVTVDDAGPGVPVEDRERVFERFARGAGAARRSLPGAGLGLAIVAETASRHGGAAWVADAPGGGARFSLSLPAVDP
ncbi:HAMP domain-containing sensor histidine kinase [Blastococcus sp. CCUG 61487]|uniref:sensor histidine kinase n=1 Tax=Blastococcus sp. CCUG 61487 TaxID=1840703 RepID=UPI0010BFD30B|nr:HAMP domain-containing sensor histidine kinase [Blastococcus sp. CCUG 61487]TKJ23390.1 two-component sensor histidine kinase [Blastococcus sp. CCUG 61487]